MLTGFFVFVCSSKRGFAIAFLFLSLFPSCRIGWTDKTFSTIAALSALDQNHSFLFDMLSDFKPCFLEINNKDRLKQGHIESCEIT